MVARARKQTETFEQYRHALKVEAQDQKYKLKGKYLYPLQTDTSTGRCIPYTKKT